MDLKKIKVDVKKTIGKDLRLVDIRENYLYEDGKRTDKLNGYSFIVLVPALGFEKIAVRIKDINNIKQWEEALEPFQDEEGEEVIPEISVEFEKIKIKLYQNYNSLQKEIEMSVTAENIIYVKSEE